MSGHFFWITTRAAGITALLLASASVGIGLTMGGRMVRRRGGDFRVLHEALALATLAALAVHVISLLLDSYFHPTILDVLVPFWMNYREPYMAMGIVGGWMLLLLGTSYYLRARIGVERWRILHRFTALAWILGLVHSIGEGTDGGQLWFLAMITIAALPLLVLLVWRWFGRPSSGGATLPLAT